MFRRLALAAWLAPALALAAPAAPTLVLSNQGRLLDAGDQPVEGNVSLTFSLYADPSPASGQAALWTDTFDVQVHQGFYALELGRPDKKPLPASVFDKPLFLEVAVGATSPVALSPRLRVGTVPRAARALVAEALDCRGCIAKEALGFSVDDIAPGAVGTTELAAGAVTADKLASGAVTADRLAAGAVTADKLPAGVISADKLAAGAVGDAQLAAGIDGAKLKAGTVGDTQLATGIDGAKLKAASVTDAQLATGIDGAKIKPGSITDALLGSGIDGSKLKAGSIVASALAGSIPTSKISGLSGLATTCPAGQALAGFDSNLSPKCVPSFSSGSFTWFPGINEYVLSDRRSAPVQENFLSLPGLNAGIAASTPSDLVVLAQGTTHTGSSYCHSGYRTRIPFLDDGNNANGQLITVNSSADNWWQNWALFDAGRIPAGLTPINVSARDSSGSGYCDYSADGLPYAGQRMAALTFAPGQVQTARAVTGQFSEGTGGPWADYGTLTVNVNLTAASSVLLLAQGDQYMRQTGGETCHAAYRYVIDNQPLGDTTHGQAIVVGEGGSHWWKPWELAYVAQLGVGTHTIKVQTRNSGGNGLCYWLGSSADQGYYGSRLIAIPFAQSDNRVSMGETNRINMTSGPTDNGMKDAVSTTFTVPSQGADVLFIGNGAQSAAAGTCHAGYDFKLDGSTRLGHPAHGLGLNVNSVGSGWWSTYTVLGSQSFASGGQHSVTLTVANSSNGGTCAWDNEGSGYARQRVIALVMPR